MKNIFFTSFHDNKRIDALIKDNEILYQKLQEAYRMYCPECKRGFDKYVGKASHDRIRHSSNPPILGRRKSQEQNPSSVPVETNNDTMLVDPDGL